MQESSTTASSSDRDEDLTINSAAVKGATQEINGSNLHIFVTMIETMLYIYEQAQVLQEQCGQSTPGGSTPGS